VIVVVFLYDVMRLLIVSVVVFLYGADTVESVVVFLYDDMPLLTL
jgi:hypothetical protein